MQNILWIFITTAYTLDYVRYSYQVIFSLPGTSAAFWILLQAVRRGRLQREDAVAIIGRGVLSFFAATSDVWMGLNKGPIRSWGYSSRGLALSFLSRRLLREMCGEGRGAVYLDRGVLYIQIPWSSQVGSSWGWGSRQTGRRYSSNGPPKGSDKRLQLSFASIFATVSWRQSQWGFHAFSPLPSIPSLLPPALLLPQIAVGLLDSCWQIARRWKLTPPHLVCSWLSASLLLCCTVKSTVGQNTDVWVSYWRQSWRN